MEMLVNIITGIFAIVGLIVWLIVVAAMVAVAGDVIGLWDAVDFV